jgi:hypothetical protein
MSASPLLKALREGVRLPQPSLRLTIAEVTADRAIPFDPSSAS